MFGDNGDVVSCLEEIESRLQTCYACSRSATEESIQEFRSIARWLNCGDVPYNDYVLGFGVRVRHIHVTGSALNLCRVQN